MKKDEFVWKTLLRHVKQKVQFWGGWKGADDSYFDILTIWSKTNHGKKFKNQIDLKISNAIQD